MLPNDPESSERATGHPAALDNAGLGSRIARARRDAGLTQRALADLVGVRLWVVDQWESGARPVPADQVDIIARATNRASGWIATGLDAGERRVPQNVPTSSERTAERRPSGDGPPAAPEVVAPVWGQLDLTFEESRRFLDERQADVARREAAVAEIERDLKQVLARTAAERTSLEQKQATLSSIEDAQRALDERRAEIGQREVELVLQEHELDEARADLESGRAQHAELEQAQRELDDRAAEVAQRETALVEREQAEPG